MPILTQRQSIAISYLRVLAIIAVLSCHFLQSVGNRWAWILNIGVQIFFFISGYLYGFKQIDDWPKWYVKRIKRVYIPFIVMVMIFLPLYYTFDSGATFSCVQFIGYISDTQWFVGGGKSLEHLWFVTAIFLCYMITPILQGIRRVAPIMLILCFGYGLFEILFIRYELKLFEPLFIYAIGYLYVNVGEKEKKIFSLTLLAITTMTIALVNWRFILDYDSIQNIMFHIFVGISFPLFFLYVAENIHRPRAYRVVTLIDKFSYQIYLLHHPLIIGSLSMMTLTSYIGCNIAIILIITIALSFLLNVISNKINSYI